MSQKVQLDVEINAETGQLTLLGSTIEGVARKGETAFQGLSGEASSLLKSLIGIGSAVGIITFFKTAVSEAEATNEALRRLRGTVEGTGQSFRDVLPDVQAWSSGIGALTRFSQTDALTTLDRLARSTRTVGEAQAASTLAMNLSVRTGKDLSVTTDIVNALITKQTRAVQEAHREFGNLAGSGATAQQILDNLSNSTRDAALNEDDLTKKLAQQRNAFSEFREEIGRAFIPVLEELAGAGTKTIKWIEALATAIARDGALLVSRWKETYDELVAITHGRLGEITDIHARAESERKVIWAEAEERGKEIYETGEQAKTDIVKKHGAERIRTTNELNAQEIAARAEAHQKLLELESELDQKIAQLTKGGLEQKLRALDSEVAAKRAQILKLNVLDTERRQALDRLNAYEKGQTEKLVRDETFLRAQLSNETVNTAISTLQTVNSLNESGSEAERIRAKALLVLQQAVAIGWVWVAAAKQSAETGNPALVSALAAAQTVAIVANTAKGIQQIDQAANQESAGISGVTINPSVPGITGGGSPSRSAGSTVSLGGSSSGGGGGGGGVTIYVGGVDLHLEIGNLDLANVREIARTLTDAARRGVIEAVQLAIQLNTTAGQKAGIAS